MLGRSSIIIAGTVTVVAGAIIGIRRALRQRANRRRIETAAANLGRQSVGNDIRTGA